MNGSYDKGMSGHPLMPLQAMLTPAQHRRSNSMSPLLEAADDGGCVGYFTHVALMAREAPRSLPSGDAQGA